MLPHAHPKALDTPTGEPQEIGGVYDEKRLRLLEKD